MEVRLSLSHRSSVSGEIWSHRSSFGGGDIRSHRASVGGDAPSLDLVLGGDEQQAPP